MKHTQWKNIEPRRPIAIIRLDDLTQAVDMSQALVEGGIHAVEFTLTNREAFNAVRTVKDELKDAVLVGAGTVLSGEDAQACIDAGAEFLVTPTVEPEVVKVATRCGVTVICGAMTPSEILSAWRLGADFVKVFPAANLGPSYIRNVRGPLPDVRMICTGGIDLSNCASFIEAGAYTVGVGNTLVTHEIVAEKDWAALTRLARRHVAACMHEE